MESRQYPLEAPSTESGDDCDDDAAVAEVENKLRATAASAMATIAPVSGTSSLHDDDRPFASEEEKWNRAKYIFSGLLEQEPKYISHPPKYTAERLIWDLIMDRFLALWEDDPERMQELTSDLGKGVELCIAMGIDETIARKRFEVLDNVREEMSLECLTPVMIQIHHLVNTLGVDHQYGNTNQIENPGVIYDDYKDKKWQSYMPIRLCPGATEASLGAMMKKIEEEKYDQCFVHGTNAKALHSINRDDGFVKGSEVSRAPHGNRHDFGHGVYVTKGEYLKALCWGLDNCWPVYNIERKCFVDDDVRDKINFPMGHNPAIVVFTDPCFDSKDIFDVHSRPLNEGEKKSVLKRAEKYDDFVGLCESYERMGRNDTKAHEVHNWKCFVKLARFYCEAPKGPTIFCGRLHKTDATTRTNECKEPVMDPDTEFLQYCFQDQSDLGTKRLFIEFDVNWNEWLNKVETQSQ